VADAAIEKDCHRARNVFDLMFVETVKSHSRRRLRRRHRTICARIVQSDPRGSLADPLYERFCDRLEAKRGVFGVHTQVELVNDGPVTLMLESRERR